MVERTVEADMAMPFMVSSAVPSSGPGEVRWGDPADRECSVYDAPGGRFDKATASSCSRAGQVRQTTAPSKRPSGQVGGRLGIKSESRSAVRRGGRPRVAE